MEYISLLTKTKNFAKQRHLPDEYYKLLLVIRNIQKDIRNKVG